MLTPRHCNMNQLSTIQSLEDKAQCRPWIPRSAGPWFNINMPSYQYRKSPCGDKTILRPSYLQHGISCTGKTASLYWIGAQIPACKLSQLFQLRTDNTNFKSSKQSIWLEASRLYCCTFLQRHPYNTNYFVVGQGHDVLSVRVKWSPHACATCTENSTETHSLKTIIEKGFHMSRRLGVHSATDTKRPSTYLYFTYGWHVMVTRIIPPW